ncbi:MAG: YdcF family protein, partial [Alphaproteobacteria bacterium]|nr:YdcF family protein [Alphaproteobacteria bacterium]
QSRNDMIVKIRTVDEEKNTDAIVVLTGGRNRITEGINLLNQKRAPILFISGVSQDVKIGELEKRLSVYADDESRIVLGYKATNTIENASEVSDWIKQNDIKSVRLVTSNYHIPRSIAELETYHLPIQIIIHPVYSKYVKKEWWKHWGSFKLIATEYNKFLFVTVRNLFH